jgi:ABC-type sugar transport system substrate-binding protein
MTHLTNRRVALIALSTLTALTLASATVSAGSTVPPTGSSESEGSEPDGTAAVEQVDASIGVSFYDNKVIPLYVQMEEGMTEAAEAAGIDIEFSYANFDPAAQVDQIEQFVTQGVDLILVTPFDRNVLIPAYESARAAGIPILSFANRVDEEYEDLFLGNDWAVMGDLMMQAVAEHLGGEGTVALISGPPEIDVVRQVNEGWQGVLDANPGLEVVAELTDPDMSQGIGLDLANTLLASNPDVDAIVCTIDQICLGAVQAVDEQGIAHDDVFIASMDADAESVEQVRSGTGIDFTISQRGDTWGRQAIAVATDVLQGEMPEEHTVPNEYVVIDAESVETLTPEDMS